MLFKIWLSLMSAVLTISFIELIIKFNLTNVFHWIYLIFLVITMTLTILIYLEKPKNNQNNLQKTYADFLKQKDKKIQELEEKNQLIFKTAVKRSEHEIELAELKKRLKEMEEKASNP